MVKTLWATLVDLIYPPKCPACNALVDKHGQWCSKCLTEIIDARPINVDRHALIALDACFAVSRYAGGVKTLMHDMKFRQIDRYAVHLAWLLERNVDPDFLKQVDLVSPVPLHAARLAERGFNQTELIFHSWAQKNGLIWDAETLVRVRPTLPQWQLMFSARQQNVRNAFAVTDAARIAGKRILLVDDIFTTGSTMDEAARALKRAGAIRVTGLALASGAK